MVPGLERAPTPAGAGPAPAFPHVTLVLGGARSGKSRFAEERVETWPGSRVYLATAEAGDDEMAERIAVHRKRRGDRWETVEEPIDLPGALRRSSTDESVVLVDCLTIWVANLMGAGHAVDVEGERLAAVFGALPGPCVLVSNEVGFGIVPDNALARRFRDEAGRLNQRIAAAADEVVLVAAGLPLHLKRASQE